MVKIESVELEWLGHASFKIKNKVTIYIDPYFIDKEKADLILVTHDHYDHCATENIKKLDKESLIIAPQSCLSKISGNVKKIEEGEKIEVKGVIIEAFPAYNLNKQFHPKGKGVGYIITLNNKRIYHAGDTDFIPEMKNLKNIDIALIPVGGTYTMDAEEAAEAVNSFKPKVAIPMHYGSIVGSRQDALNFKKLVKESEVKILE